MSEGAGPRVCFHGTACDGHGVGCGPEPGPCGDPECNVLHDDPANPIHPPWYVDSRTACTCRPDDGSTDPFGPDGCPRAEECLRAFEDRHRATKDWERRRAPLVEGGLMLEALVGIARKALEVDVAVVMGGVMVDARFFRTVLELAAREQNRRDLAAGYEASNRVAFDLLRRGHHLDPGTRADEAEAYAETHGMFDDPDRDSQDAQADKQS